MKQEEESLIYGRVIWDNMDSTQKYITRTLFPRLRGRRYMLHRIHIPDTDRGIHNHPWEWCRSHILTGSYVEERLLADGTIETKIVDSYNELTKDDFHRIVELRGEVWTLFEAGPRYQDWGFKVEGRFVPWRDYVSEANK
jgi:hypothetical protein